MPLIYNFSQFKRIPIICSGSFNRVYTRGKLSNVNREIHADPVVDAIEKIKGSGMVQSVLGRLKTGKGIIKLN